MLKGKIILAAFPFDDLTAAKVRPAICLTEPLSQNQHVILAFITSRIPTDLQPSDLILEEDSVDFSPTGLKVTSTIRLHRLITISTSVLKREIGQVSLETYQEIKIRLKQLLLED